MSDRNITYRGTNSKGNNYTKYANGGYNYNNKDKSSYADNGRGHQHYTDPSGSKGWHYNSNKGYFTGGQQYRDSNTRHDRK